jgi:hypothetical protein
MACMTCCAPMPAKWLVAATSVGESALAEDAGAGVEDLKGVLERLDEVAGQVDVAQGGAAGRKPRQPGDGCDEVCGCGEAGLGGGWFPAHGCW